MVEQFYLDGSPESVGGTAVTPSAYDEGVESNGDTWTETSTNEGQDWTKAFTNTLGQQYMTEQSALGGGSATETSTTDFDGNGRPDKITGFDGTVTFTDYNPATGEVADTWEDVSGTGVYTPGVDPKTISADTAKTSSDSIYSGETDTAISEAGNIADFTGEKNAGLDSEEVSDGQTTQTHTELNTPAAGDTTVITSNPDGTQTKDVYTNGLLTEEDTLGTDGSQITRTTYGYDALARDDSITDWTGTTTFTLRADGSVSQVQLPDGTTQTVDDTDAKDDTPTTVTQPNGADQSQTLNTRGQELTQSGTGELPAEFGYDDNTGAMLSMDLFQSGTLDSGTPEATTWAYDPATGLMTSQTFSDGTSDSYAYNAKSQLTGTTEPGVFINYNYNTAAQQISSTATDNETEIAVTDSTGGYDDQGRPTSVTQTQTEADVTQYSATNALTYTPQGDLASETQAGDVTTEYSYYPTTGFGSDGAPDALESVKLVRIGTPNVVLSETDYGYSSITKRLATVTINGQTFTYSYKAGTNLISGISAAAVTTDFSYGATTGLLTGINASAGTSNLYTAGYTYNAEQQRATDTIAQANPDGSTTDTNWTYGYNAQNELTTVTDTGTGATLYDYGYDGAGNQDGSSFVSQYGTASTMNQYANISYNARGDETNDGTLIYTWDAKDELTGETPVSPTTGSTKLEFEYDAQGRRTQTEVYTYGAGGWSDDPTNVLKYAYQGSNLVGVFDADNNLLVGLSWGPSGLLSVTDYTTAVPTTYQVIQDANGNTVALINASTGAVAASFRYDPYGNILSATGPAANVCPILWGGMVYDGAGFAYYDAARYYSPAQGRFISRDPSAESGGLNLTEYGDDDPINEIDTSGLNVVPKYIMDAQAQQSTPLTDDQIKALEALHEPNSIFQQTDAALKQAEQQHVAATQEIAREKYYGTISPLRDATTTEKILNYNNEFQQAIENTLTSAVNGPIKITNAVAQSFTGNRGSNSRNIPNFWISERQPYQFSLQYAADPEADEHIEWMQKGIAVGAIFLGAPEAEIAPATDSLSYFGGQPLDLGLGDSLLSSTGGQPLDLGLAEDDLSLTGWRPFEGAAAESAATAPRSISLDILNPQFTPNGTSVLQNLTTQVNEGFASNLSLATTVLSPEELLAAAEYPGLARSAYGNALERLVAQEVEADPVLDSLYRHVGGPNNPDFVGQGPFKGMNFDITTPAQSAAHLARPGYGPGLNIVTYQRPPGFP